MTAAKAIMGPIPCHAIPDAIVFDHPKRFRALLIESANPMRSLADSLRMRLCIAPVDAPRLARYRS